MTEKLGRYDCDLIKRLDEHPNILKDLVAKPRGANNNKEGRAFELAYGTYVVLLEIAAVLERGISNPPSIAELRRLSYNDRPICLVDDAHLVGLAEETYAQLKHGSFKWPDIECDFSRQIDLDKAHGLKLEYRFVVGLPRNIKLLQQRLEEKDLGVVVAEGYDFPAEYLRRIDANPPLASALETITGTTYPQWMEAAYKSVLTEIEQSRSQVGLMSLVRRLHEDRPHLFHPLEEQHSYDFLVDLLYKVAPDVGAKICGPTLRLWEAESRESYTIPWGSDELVDGLALELRSIDDSPGEEFLNLSDIQGMLSWHGWERAMPKTRTRRYLDEGIEA